MSVCPDCNGVGFVEHGHEGHTDFLPCHFCDQRGEVDMDGYLNGVYAQFALAAESAAVEFEDLPY